MDPSYESEEDKDESNKKRQGLLTVFCYYGTIFKFFLELVFCKFMCMCRKSQEI